MRVERLRAPRGGERGRVRGAGRDCGAHETRRPCRSNGKRQAALCWRPAREPAAHARRSGFRFGFGFGFGGAVRAANVQPAA